jgi:hypothetical protein
VHPTRSVCPARTTACHLAQPRDVVARAANDAIRRLVRERGAVWDAQARDELSQLYRIWLVAVRCTDPT